MNEYVVPENVRRIVEILDRSCVVITGTKFFRRDNGYSIDIKYNELMGKSDYVNRIDILTQNEVEYIREFLKFHAGYIILRRKFKIIDRCVVGHTERSLRGLLARILDWNFNN